MTLDLDWNNIGAEGAQRLAEALEKNQTLTTLHLDINNIGNWPALVKSIVIAIACAIVIGGVIYKDTSDQITNLEKIQKDEDTLKIRLKAKAAKAAVLNELRAQLEEMREDLWKKRKILKIIKEINI